jgi:hypothetical protein
MSDGIDRPGQWSARALQDALKETLLWHEVAIHLAQALWGADSYELGLSSMRDAIKERLPK